MVTPNHRIAETLGQDPGAVPGFDLIQSLGAGGEGRVFKAVESRTGQIVALKILNGPDQPSPSVEFATALHPALPRLLGAGSLPSGERYEVYEFIEGQTMAQLIEGEEVSIDGYLALAMATELAEALVLAHELGIVHRDLKPENILIGQGFHPTLIDFGGDPRVTERNPYVAPETVTSDESLSPADVYSFGAIMHALLRPRDHDQPPDRSEPRLEPSLIPDELQTWIASALDPTPANRPTMRSFVEVARGLLESLQVTVTIGTEQYVRKYGDRLIIGRSTNTSMQADRYLSREALAIELDFRGLEVWNIGKNQAIISRRDGTEVPLFPGEMLRSLDDEVDISLRSLGGSYGIHASVDRDPRLSASIAPAMHPSSETVRSDELRLTQRERELVAAYCVPLLGGGPANPYSHQQVARMLGISSLTARNRMTRLLERIRSELGPNAAEALTDKDDLCRYMLQMNVVSPLDILATQVGRNPEGTVARVWLAEAQDLSTPAINMYSQLLTVGCSVRCLLEVEGPGGRDQGKGSDSLYQLKALGLQVRTLEPTVIHTLKSDHGFHPNDESFALFDDRFLYRWREAGNGATGGVSNSAIEIAQASRLWHLAWDLAIPLEGGM